MREGGFRKWALGIVTWLERYIKEKRKYLRRDDAPSLPASSTPIPRPLSLLPFASQLPTQETLYTPTVTKKRKERANSPTERDRERE
jgi:hypothetical protein